MVIIIEPRHYVQCSRIVGKELAWWDIVDIWGITRHKEKFLRCGVESAEENLSVRRAMPWPYEYLKPEGPDYHDLLNRTVEDYYRLHGQGVTDDDERNPIGVRNVHRLFRDIPEPEEMTALEGLA